MYQVHLLPTSPRMTKDLAIVKKAYLISMSNWDKETVLLENEPDRVTMIAEKHVVQIDWVTLNFSYAVSAKEINLADDWVDSAMAYAKSLKGAIKVVACERVRWYEAKSGEKMPLTKLKDRLQSFYENGKSQDREKRYKLFLSAWGSPDDIL